MQNEDNIALVLIECAKCLIGNGNRAEAGIAFQGH